MYVWGFFFTPVLSTDLQGLAALPLEYLRAGGNHLEMTISHIVFDFRKSTLKPDSVGQWWVEMYLATCLFATPVLNIIGSVTYLVLDHRHPWRFACVQCVCVYDCLRE